MKRSGSTYFRKPEYPNKRLQDGSKIYLLSSQAEQEFSLKEKWFAENIFVPYLANEKKLIYNKNLHYFVISFLWRVIIANLKCSKTIKNNWYFNDLMNVEKEWRSYLIDENTNEISNKIYILFTDRVQENNSNLKGVDMYFTRTMDATIVDNENQTTLLVYGKFSRFIFWSVLKKYGGEENLIDSEINPKGGVLHIPQNLNYYPLISFLNNRIKEINKFPLANEKQQDLILKEILKSSKKFWDSDVGKSLFNDKFNLEE